MVPSQNALLRTGSTTYWIDGPGSLIDYDPSAGCGTLGAGTRPIDSMTFAFNFAVTYSEPSTGFSRIVYHYVKLVVSSGGHLDTTNSVAGYGNIPLTF